jgi:hypothetical protein
MAQSARAKRARSSICEISFVDADWIREAAETYCEEVDLEGMLKKMEREAFLVPIPDDYSFNEWKRFKIHSLPQLYKEFYGTNFQIINAKSPRKLKPGAPPPPFKPPQAVRVHCLRSSRDLIEERVSEALEAARDDTRRLTEYTTEQLKKWSPPKSTVVADLRNQLVQHYQNFISISCDWKSGVTITTLRVLMDDVVDDIRASIAAANGVQQTQSAPPVDPSAGPPRRPSDAPQGMEQQYQARLVVLTGPHGPTDASTMEGAMMKLAHFLTHKVRALYRCPIDPQTKSELTP